MAMMARRGSRQTIGGPIVGGRSVAQISPVIMWARSGSDLTAYYMRPMKNKINKYDKMITEILIKCSIVLNLIFEIASQTATYCWPRSGTHLARMKSMRARCGLDLGQHCLLSTLSFQNKANQ